MELVENESHATPSIESNDVTLIKIISIRYLIVKQLPDDFTDKKEYLDQIDMLIDDGLSNSSDILQKALDEQTLFQIMKLDESLPISIHQRIDELNKKNSQLDAIDIKAYANYLLVSFQKNYTIIDGFNGLFQIINAKTVLEHFTCLQDLISNFESQLMQEMPLESIKPFAALYAMLARQQSTISELSVAIKLDALVDRFLNISKKYRRNYQDIKRKLFPGTVIETQANTCKPFCPPTVKDLESKLMGYSCDIRKRCEELSKIGLSAIVGEENEFMITKLLKKIGEYFENKNSKQSLLKIINEVSRKIHDRIETDEKFQEIALDIMNTADSILSHIEIPQDETSLYNLNNNSLNYSFFPVEEQSLPACEKDPKKIKVDTKQKFYTLIHQELENKDIQFHEGVISFAEAKKLMPKSADNKQGILFLIMHPNSPNEVFQFGFVSAKGEEISSKPFSFISDNLVDFFNNFIKGISSSENVSNMSFTV